MPFVPGLTVRILTHETARAGRRTVVDATLAIVRREGLRGVTITRATEGYSEAHGVRSASWVDLADDLPVSIELSDEAERIERVLPELTTLVTEGALTVASVRLWQADEQPASPDR